MVSSADSRALSTNSALLRLGQLSTLRVATTRRRRKETTTPTWPRRQAARAASEHPKGCKLARSEASTSEHGAEQQVWGGGRARRRSRARDRRYASPRSPRLGQPRSRRKRKP